SSKPKKPLPRAGLRARIQAQIGARTESRTGFTHEPDLSHLVPPGPAPGPGSRRGAPAAVAAEPFAGRGPGHGPGGRGAVQARLEAERPAVPPGRRPRPGL